MEHKKKFLGGLKLLLVPLFIMVLGMLSVCYANVSEDYIDFCVNKIIENNPNNNLGLYLSSLKSSTNGISNLTSTINSSLTTADYSSGRDGSLLTDYNLICFGYIGSNSTRPVYLNFIFTNCTFDNGISNLGYLNYNKQYYSSINGSYLLQTFEIYSSGSFWLSSNSWLNEQRNTWTNFFDNYNANGDIISISNYYNYSPTQSIYVSADGLNKYYLLSSPTNTYLNVYPPTPPEPSGDSPTEPSGDIPVNPSGDSGSGSAIDYTNQLNNINNSIDNVNNSVQNVQSQISGDTQKITNSINNINNTLTSPADMDNTTINSGDILDNFSFMADPYSNFWWDFIDGVELALLGSVRQLPVNWLGYQGYFNLDGLINYPTSIKNILTTVSTVSVVWVMIKWWKVIMDKLTSGDIDEVLEIVEEQGRVNITNLF